VTALDRSLTELPHGTIMRQDAPWTAIGMSRASWYRHGKPAAKPTRRKTNAELAREIHVSVRTLYRASKELREEKRAKLIRYRAKWLHRAIKKAPEMSDEQLCGMWNAHIASLSEEQLAKICRA